MRITKILAGILLVLALGLAFLAWMLSREAPRDVQPVTTQQVSGAPPETESTQVQSSHGSHWAMGAKRHVAAGQRLTEADIAQVTTDAVVSGSFGQADDLLGKTTLVAFAPGQVFQEQYMVNGLSLQLEPGQRAISIAVKEPMAVGHHIRPGDFVDVFISLQSEGSESKDVAQTRRLLARARVLAYGASTVESPPPTFAQRQAASGSESSARSSGREDGRARIEAANTAVLAIPLKDVRRLTLAEKYGQLSLVLRHPDDLEAPDAVLPQAGRESAFWSQTHEPVDQDFAGLSLGELAVEADTAQGTNAAGSHSKMHKVPRHTKGDVQGQTIELLHGSTSQAVSY